MNELGDRCCICGCALPNRWAVGGGCGDPGCQAKFCKLHAAQGNGRCREHGWREKGMKTKNEPVEVNPQSEAASASPESRERERRLVGAATKDLAKQAMAETVALAGKIGAGLKGLWAKIHVDRSPEAMLASLNGSLDENRARRGVVSDEMEALHGRIAAKKKAYETASPVRQRMLKTELQTLMAQYKSLEREFELVSENERNIMTVKGRFMEMIAHGMRGRLDEDLIDRLADGIEDKTEEAESVEDAMGDLEKAGRRRDRETGDFDAELAAFGEPEDAAAESPGTIEDAEPAAHEPRETAPAAREPEKRRDRLPE